VLFLHGRHATCFNPANGSATYARQCAAGETEILSYRGYDYLASLLASHGMIVASISANAVNAGDDGTGDLGTTARADLIRHHLDTWKTFSTTGGAPFGATFVGKVDLQNVGTMGHSRGGAGITKHYIANAAAGSPYGIRAMLPIAPAFTPDVPSNVPLAVLLGYCDGDLEQLPGVRQFDGARYAVLDDQTPKYMILGLGANHNFFNRYWTPDQFGLGATDDWADRDADTEQADPYCGINAATNQRLSSSQQRSFAKAYVAAFFRQHLLGQSQFESNLTGDTLPASVQSANVVFAHRAAAHDRSDLNPMTTSSQLPSSTTAGTNTFQGSVTAVGMTAAFCVGSDCTPGAYRRAHFGDLGAAKLNWSSTNAVLSNTLPLFRRDVSNFAVFQFRAAVNYTDSANPIGQPQDLRVRFVDARGGTSIVRVSDYSDGLYYPPGSNPSGTKDFRAAIMNDVRLPMNAMLNVDLTNLASVDLLFDQRPSGSLLVSDLAFTGDGISIAEQVLVLGGMI
jgi:hypothetical protein